MTHPLLQELERRANGAVERRADGTLYLLDIDVELARMMRDQLPPTQRELNKRVARQYAETMRDGRWRSVYDTMRFDCNMNFIDGQHRIEAVILGDGAFVLKEQLIVVLPFSAETMALPIDSGHKRTRADFERSMGVTVPAAVSSGILREHLDFCDSTQLVHLDKIQQGQIVKNSPVRERIVTIPKISRAPAGVVAGIARILKTTTDQREVLDFFGQVMENKHIFRGKLNTNIQHLATWILESRGKSFSGTQTFNDAALRTMATWNAHRKDVTYPKRPPLPRVDHVNEYSVIP